MLCSRLGRGAGGVVGCTVRESYGVSASAVIGCGELPA